MQSQNLVEMHRSVNVSSQLPLKVQPEEIYANSVVENNGRANGHNVNRSKNLDGSLDVEMVQKNLVSKSCEGRAYEASPGNLLGTVESSSTWGDFEVFSEVKLNNLSETLESLEKIHEKQTHANSVDTGNHFTTSWTQFFSQTAGHSRREASANDPKKAVLSSEDIIKQSFPEVPVPQFLEKINSLEHVLGTKTEDADIPECTKQELGTASTNLWKTLIHSSNPPSLQCPWNGSHYQENLLAVLGIDPHQKVLPEGKDDILEKTNIRENEDSSVDKCNISKALIQTKLSVCPDPRQSHLFRYNLFLKKTPPTGNMQYITVPQKKKIFTTQNLRMKMFNSNVC
uniref:Uncharacterized protein C14orf79 homolog n=1 Tax=Pogona vitticeps TaxID=103695 RepID=A0A6J0VIF0_9SAUR|nr:uncharacterized protein C14orf79 homolog [Pogona vitticeps]XP_020670508.1 uncharacterized protein C14orf79 homolog [Pogona vitticeps]XP_020670509.1 uncharacterized protein C14orf79 homolog [Pogona vitticeps]